MFSKLFNRPVKLTYTDEMQVQDHLWESGNEDSKIMKNLQEAIVKEAKEKGFEGVTMTFIADWTDEAITEVFDSEESMKKELKTGCGNHLIGTTSNCSTLIEILEGEINKKRKVG